MNDLVVREAYTLSSNPISKLADWVAYRVSGATIQTQDTRTLTADPWLAADRTLEATDYEGAYTHLGVDQGHQAPLASLGGTSTWETTNYYSNITPQGMALNRGAWRQLEDAIRNLVRASGVEQKLYDAVYVLTGPLYERAMPPLPQADEPHRLPSGYWKVIAVEAEGGVMSAAFILDQPFGKPAQASSGEGSHATQPTQGRVHYCDGLVPLSEVEVRSRLLLFPRLDPRTRALQIAATSLATHLGCTPP